ncbi:IucA/IucC family protein [Paenibacillus maysiensis]|uniref:IucA/IucC family protein n=1 Tax=Paenibacillus maysiensis TaxID=1155954 RepID=UPI000472C5BB|nr:IucA/IucC family protein [Paenibacillus maysiensis]
MLTQSTEISTIAGELSKSRIWAEQATLRALVNSYLRETRQFDPRIKGEAPKIKVILPRFGLHITGTLHHFSATGQHVYGSNWYEVEEGGTHRSLDMDGIIQRLLDEMSYHAKPEQREAEQQKMKQRIRNSMHKMTLFMDHHTKTTGESKPKSFSSTEVHLTYVRSEQSLLIGHPFHPFPKSTEGFADYELPLYSPEMGAAFPLYYFAVHEDNVQEEWIGEEHRRDAIDPSVLLHARRQWGEELARYRILPMHPWQAERVLRQSHIQSLMRQRVLIPLGALGPVVYPTSSIRTVWDLKTGNGYKLPLHVRITNLVRDNTQEQARRTLDAAKVIHELSAAWSSHIQSESFKVLTETGYSRVCFQPNEVVKRTEIPESTKDAGLSQVTTTTAKYNAGHEHSAAATERGTTTVQELEQLSDQFTVLYRPMDLNPESTYVVASLLESLPGEQGPRLIAVIRDNYPSKNGERPDLLAWLERYLHISMVPMLRLLAVKGIAFEAHVQNSLLFLQDGWPECYYVRDLEGVSIVREQAEAAGWVGSLIAEDSPVLYGAEEPWMRTRYYFFVNHLGALIHALAVHDQHSEQEYWRVVRKVLEQLQEQDASSCSRLAAYIQDLLTAPTLPAKANFTSCFQSRGDTPSFIPIPNPIHFREVTSCL